MVIQPSNVSTVNHPEHLVLCAIEDFNEALLALHDPEMVHSARVSVKRLRAWLRLTRYTVDAAAYRKIDALLKEASTSLAGQRDRYACIETLQWLMQRDKRRAVRNVASKIIMDLSNGISRDEDSLVVTEPEQLIDVLVTHFNDSYENIDVEYGLEKSFRKARKLGRLAFSNAGSVDDLHQFRKWCKYLYYQQELYPEFDYLTTAKDRKRFAKIGKAIGRFHDLMLIRAYVSCQSSYVSFQESELLMNAISLQYHNLYAKSRRHFKRAF